MEAQLDFERMSTASDLRCQHLLLVATQTEEEELGRAAKDLGLPFEECAGRTVTYRDLGPKGPGRILALRTEMGPLGYGGSAAQAIYSKNETEAVGGVISVGMCFGVDRTKQSLGDIIISSSLLPYDNRDVKAHGRLPQEDFSRVRRHPAKESLRAMLERSKESQERDFTVHVGAILSGGARIHCGAYRDHLVNMLSKAAEDTIVGGEMEGIGLLSLSPLENPGWIVVKGICDFADEQRGGDVKSGRKRACYNSARFVLEALAAERMREEVKENS